MILEWTGWVNFTGYVFSHNEKFQSDIQELVVKGTQPLRGLSLRFSTSLKLFQSKNEMKVRISKLKVNPLSVSVDRSVLDVSHGWNHTLRVPLCLLLSLSIVFLELVHVVVSVRASPIFVAE